MMIAFLGIGLLPVIIIAVTALIVSNDALSDQIFRDLTNIRDAKKDRIISFFDERATDLTILLESVDSLRRAAFDKLMSVQENKKALLEHRFNAFLKNTTSLSKNIVITQALKDFESSIDVDGNVDWVLYRFFEREKYASSLREFADLYGFYDLLLVSKKGTVVYSVKKEEDLGENLLEGRLKKTGVAHCFSEALQGPFIHDYERYAPSHDRHLAFMGSPIKGSDGSVSGVLMVKLSSDAIDSIVRRREGMGITGETYVVSMVDHAVQLRSDRLVKTGLFGDIADDIDIGQTFDDRRNEPFIRIGENGASELVVYDPIDIPGLQWVMVSVMDFEEVIDPRKTALTDDFFSRYVNAYPLQDLYLISPEGVVFYSAKNKKAIDAPAVSLNGSSSPLATIYNKVKETQTLSYVDFTPFEYAGETMPYSFLGQPLIHGKRIELIVVLQIPVSPFNEMMAIPDRTQRTKDLYLVGADKLLRSDSQLIPQTFSVIGAFQELEAKQIDTAPVRQALSGHGGTMVARDYRGETVFSAFTHLNVMGIKWAVIAEIDRDEALAPLRIFSILVFFFAILMAGVILGLSFLIARYLTAPVLYLKQQVEKLRLDRSNQEKQVPWSEKPLEEMVEQSHEKNLELESEVGGLPISKSVPPNDELKLLAEAFNDMAMTIQSHTRALEQKIVLLEKADAKAKKNQAELLLSENVFKHTIEGIVITDSDGIIQRVNRAFTEITGYSEEEVIGQKPRILKSDRHDPEFYASMWQTLLTQGQWSGEIWNRRKDGSAYPEWLSISSLRDHQGEITHFISLFHDISENKMKDEQLQFLAFHDPLTQLPNRKLFYDRARVALKSAKRSHCKMALLYMDVDNFKNVNDAFGHPFGDELLCVAKQSIASICRESDTFARYGGDEFVIILNDIRHVRDAEDFSQRLVDLFKTPLNVMGEKIYTSISVGLSVYPDDGEDIVSLEQNADMALYEAKKAGKRKTFRYRRDLQDAMLQKVTLESKMREALEDCSTFQLLYQPKVDIETQRIHGVEALLRWFPDGELVSPGAFIPIAEESDMIIPLGEWVMHRAMSDIKKIHDLLTDSTRDQADRHQESEGPSLNMPPLNVAGDNTADPMPWFPYLSINLSTKQFNDKNLFDIIEKGLTQTGYNRSRLIFEITESIPMQNVEHAIEIMHRLNQMGVALSIDDFGTGYSSLSYLKQFSIHELKIDRSFVKDLPGDTMDAAISHTIIDMAHNLNFQVVAEGVETREQLDFLKTHGCRLIQGFLFYKPLTIDALREVMANERK